MKPSAGQAGPDDVAVIVGAGGVGGFGVQIAAAMGSAVVAIDVDQERLELASQHGAGLVLDSNSMDLKSRKPPCVVFKGSWSQGDRTENL
jgi:6-hydroxycyclohex-1-ene-1-carbonyl-CoA dehydrogenase